MAAGVFGGKNILMDHFISCIPSLEKNSTRTVQEKRKDYTKLFAFYINSIICLAMANSMVWFG